MRNNNKIVIGIVLIFIGLIFIADEIGLHFISFSSLFPLALIGLGVWMIVRRRKMETKSEEMNSQSYSTNFNNTPPNPPPVEPFEPAEPMRPSDPGNPEDFAQQQAQSTSYTFHKSSGHESKTNFHSTESPYEESNGKLKYNKFIGDMNISFKNRPFQDIEVSTFIGNTDVYFEGAQLSPGLNRVIISGFIGDVKIFVPKGMAVFANCSNFLGDIEACGRKSSSFGNNIECQSDNYSSADKKIYIAVNCFIGEIRLIEL